jgi:hypothetical protein
MRSPESTETRNGEPAPEQIPQSSILISIPDDPSQILSQWDGFGTPQKRAFAINEKDWT